MRERRATWSFYDQSTGTLVGRTYSGPESLLPLNTPDGHKAVEGRHDHLCRRVDLETGAVIAWQPPRPSAEHEWHAGEERWKLTGAALKRREIIAQILALEAKQPRAVREAILGQAGALERLKALDDEITALRAQLKS